MKKHFYVKRLDSKHNGDEVLIPEEHLAITLRQHKTWKVVGEYSFIKPEPTPVIIPNTETKQSIECPLCGKNFKNQNGLRLHKKVHNK